MAPEQKKKKRVGTKLTKKRKPQRHASVQYPERLKEGEDVHEDVTAPKGKTSQNMNQSVFSMIAAAGSKVDFHARFEDESSDGEDVESSSVVLESQNQASEPSDESSMRQTVCQRYEHRSDYGTRRHLPKFNLRTIREKNYMAQSSQAEPAERTSPIPSSANITPRDAPVMSMMLEAQAQLGSSIADLATQEESKKISEQHGSRAGLSNLVIRLKEIFGFEKPEEVISGTFLDIATT